MILTKKSEEVVRLLPERHVLPIRVYGKIQKNDNKNDIWSDYTGASSYAIVFYRDIYWIFLIIPTFSKCKLIVCHAITFPDIPIPKQHNNIHNKLRLNRNNLSGFCFFSCSFFINLLFKINLFLLDYQADDVWMWHRPNVSIFIDYRIFLSLYFPI